MRSKFYSCLMSLGHLTADMNQGALSAVLPFLIATYHYDFATAGLIMMFYSVVGSFVQPIFGQLADKHFNLWILPISLAFACGGMAFTGITDNFVTLCIAATLSGVGVSMFHPIAALILNRTAPVGKLGECLSIFSFGGNMGFVIGPIVSTTAVTYLGLRGTLVMLIPALIAPLASCTSRTSFCVMTIFSSPSFSTRINCLSFPSLISLWQRRGSKPLFSQSSGAAILPFLSMIPASRSWAMASMRPEPQIP